MIPVDETHARMLVRNKRIARDIWIIGFGNALATGFAGWAVSAAQPLGSRLWALGVIMLALVVACWVTWGRIIWTASSMHVLSEMYADITDRAAVAKADALGQKRP